MAEIILKDICKSFGETAVVKHVDRGWGIFGNCRAFRLREVYDSPDDCRAGAADFRRNMDFWKMCQLCSAGKTGYRHGFPELCDLSDNERER